MSSKKKSPSTSKPTPKPRSGWNGKPEVITFVSPKEKKGK
jgi:hypothetical protein